MTTVLKRKEVEKQRATHADSVLRKHGYSSTTCDQAGYLSLTAVHWPNRPAIWSTRPFSPLPLSSSRLHLSSFIPLAPRVPSKTCSQTIPLICYFAFLLYNPEEKFAHVKSFWSILYDLANHAISAPCQNCCKSIANRLAIFLLWSMLPNGFYICELLSLLLFLFSETPPFCGTTNNAAQGRVQKVREILDVITEARPPGVLLAHGQIPRSQIFLHC